MRLTVRPQTLARVTRRLAAVRVAAYTKHMIDLLGIVARTLLLLATMPLAVVVCNGILGARHAGTDAGLALFPLYMIAFGVHLTLAIMINGSYLARSGDYRPPVRSRFIRVELRILVTMAFGLFAAQCGAKVACAEVEGTYVRERPCPGGHHQQWRSRVGQNYWYQCRRQTTLCQQGTATQRSEPGDSVTQRKIHLSTMECDDRACQAAVKWLVARSTGPAKVTGRYTAPRPPLTPPMGSHADEQGRGMRSDNAGGRTPDASG